MITSQGKFARPYRQDFYQPGKISDVAETQDKKGKQQDKVLREYQSVENMNLSITSMMWQQTRHWVHMDIGSYHITI